MLIRNGAEVNAWDKRGCTPLMLAAEKGRTETVEMLLSKGADVNAKDKHGNTALWWARNSAEIQEILKRYGAKE
jgi:ankyrin repeat protein